MPKLIIAALIVIAIWGSAALAAKALIGIFVGTMIGIVTFGLMLIIFTEGRGK